MANVTGTAQVVWIGGVIMHATGQVTRPTPVIRFGATSVTAATN